MRSPARQLGRVSGAPTNAPPCGGLIGVVKDGASFHASFKGRRCPEVDLWGSFLNIAVHPRQFYCDSHFGTTAMPSVFSAAAFPLDTPPEVDRICPRGISARGRLVPTSKSRHLKKADEG
jgi:hypothetical protein